MEGSADASLPSKNVIQFLLNYSKSFKVVELNNSKNKMELHLN